MIRLLSDMPKSGINSAERLKIMLNKNACGSDALLWEQEKGRAYISCFEGNAVIENIDGDIDEISEFLKVISPKTVLCDHKTAVSVFGESITPLYVYSANTDDFKSDIVSDDLLSGDVYGILLKSGLNLPEYEYFAADYCHKKNNGLLKVFVIKDKCAAIGQHYDKMVLISGVASLEKGGGKAAVNGLLSQYHGYKAYCICNEKNRGFYEKCGFCYEYKLGFWSKL